MIELAEENIIFFCANFSAIAGCSKDRLHAGLRVVKVAVDCANADVIPLLRCHLKLLHGAYALFRVEYEDFRYWAHP